MTARPFTDEENRILNEALRTDKRDASKQSSKAEQRIAESLHRPARRGRRGVRIVDAAHLVFRLLRHHAVSGNHVADATLRQDVADDDALLAVLPRQKERQHEQGVNLSKCRSRTTDTGAR